MVFCGAFIQINAFQSISNPTCLAFAPEAAGGVDTRGVDVAVVCAYFTFIDICTSGGSLLHKVPQLTVADEGAFSVLALSVEADVGVQVTFIDVYTRLHIQRSHEAIEAQTAIFSGDVCTLPAVTNVWVVLAFINISAGSLVRHQCISLATAAFIAAFRVGTLGVASSVHDCAFIDIYTTLPIGS